MKKIVVLVATFLMAVGSASAQIMKSADLEKYAKVR